jgi:hypothetical protein
MGRTYKFEAVDAVREQILARIGIAGSSGAGKSYTALMLGAAMVEKLELGPLYVIDTEHKSALRYAFSPKSGKGFKFKHVVMPPEDNSTQAYDAALTYCEQQGAGVIVIDSLSHMWNGIGGVLEVVDKTSSANKFSTGWKEQSPIYNRAIERVMQTKAHVIFTVRQKQEWVLEEQGGKKVPVKVGLGEVARDGISYEPDLFARMESLGKGRVRFTIEKGRVIDFEDLAVGAFYDNPGEGLANNVVAWCQDGERAPAQQPKVAIEQDPILAIEDGNPRAGAWRKAIGACTDVYACDALGQRIDRDPHDGLRQDATAWLAARRKRIIADAAAKAKAAQAAPANGAPAAPGSQPASSNPPTDPMAAATYDAFGDGPAPTDPEDFPR